MADSRKKLFRKPGYKPFWEGEEEEEVEKPVEEVVPEEKKDRFPMISGLMKQGLGPVIRKKKK